MKTEKEIREKSERLHAQYNERPWSTGGVSLGYLQALEWVLS